MVGATGEGEVNTQCRSGFDCVVKKDYKVSVNCTGTSFGHINTIGFYVKCVRNQW